jgi:hypothetical protein
MLGKGAQMGRNAIGLTVVSVDGLRVDGDLDVAGVFAVGLENFVFRIGVASVAVLALLLDVLGVGIVHSIFKLVRGMRLQFEFLVKFLFLQNY